MLAISAVIVIIGGAVYAWFSEMYNMFGEAVCWAIGIPLFIFCFGGAANAAYKSGEENG